MKRQPLPVPLVCLAALALFAPTLAGGTVDGTASAGPASRPASPPFENEIKAFEAADAKHAPPRGAVLFVGSSSIRKWTTLSEDFPGLTAINRGFGGSTIPDSTRYAPRIVVPYQPKAIVFYAGDNDVAGGHKPERVAADFKDFVGAVRAGLPRTPIVFIPIKPSLARVKQIPTQAEANRLIREYIATDKSLSYVDVTAAMLGEDGKPRPELFGPDGLHMNHDGYKIWAAILAPKLKELTSGAAAPHDGAKPETR